MVYHRGMTRISLEDVAGVFNAAVDEGIPPARQVAIEFAAHPSTTAYWIRRAKDRGLILDESFAGKQKNKKLEAVALDLGITSARLAESLRKHAGGDLRISPEHE